MRSVERFSEPWGRTLGRTVGLALAIGFGVALYQRRPTLAPITALLALWFTLGGHFIELWCRNGLRPMLPNRALALIARLAAWFVGGSALYGGALATRSLLTGRPAPPWPWWSGGVFFIAAELLIHSWLLGRGQPSAFDGRG